MLLARDKRTNVLLLHVKSCVTSSRTGHLSRRRGWAFRIHSKRMQAKAEKAFHGFTVSARNKSSAFAA